MKKQILSKTLVRSLIAVVVSIVSFLLFFRISSSQTDLTPDQIKIDSIAGNMRLYFLVNAFGAVYILIGWFSYLKYDGIKFLNRKSSGKFGFHVLKERLRNLIAKRFNSSASGEASSGSENRPSDLKASFISFFLSGLILIIGIHIYFFLFIAG